MLVYVYCSRVCDDPESTMKFILGSDIITYISPVCPDEGSSSAGDRRKWESGVALVLPVLQQTLVETHFTTIGKLLVGHIL